MKKTIILLVLILIYGLFLPNHVAADYSKDLDTCNKILSKSSSPNEYCTLHIDAISGDRVTGPMVVISNSYIYPESGVSRATKFLEEEYKDKLDWMRDPSDQSKDLAKYMKVIEDVGPENMKFLIRQNPVARFYSPGPKKIIYTYHSYLLKQQGSCIMVIDGTANIGYVKSQNNKIDDVSGDVESLKKESITYMNKVGNDLTKNCKKEIIKTETPAAPALIDKPPKEGYFKKVSKSDFKLIYPVSSDSASLKPATQSANLKGNVFIGKVDGDGEIVIERKSEDDVVLKDNMTAFYGPETHPFFHANSTVPGSPDVLRYYFEETNCQYQLEQGKQEQESLQRLGFIRKVSRYDFGTNINVAPVIDCSFIFDGGPVRVLAEKRQVAFKTLGDVVAIANKADFGIGYDAKSALSIVEVYNGSVTVTNKSGQSKIISTVYGSEIKQIEIAKDGTMTEKTAIPQSEWEAFLASQQKKEQEANARSSFLIISGVVVLSMGGLIFFLYRTGRLISLYKTLSQKVFDMLKKLNKADKQEKKN